VLAGVSEYDIQALRRIYAAITRWDLDELVADVAHDIEWSLPEPLPWGGTRHGHDGIRAFATLFRDHVEGSWADPDDFLDAGDRIVVLGRLRGRARATGEDFEVEFAHVWALSDGMASRCRSYFDTAPILAALEGRPPPEPPAEI
jgi:ketosteroid isomerase-like protein